MTITATLINLYHVCKREMWLHANGIRMEHTSETVAEGKQIGETTYPQRAEKYTELELSSPFGGGWVGAGKIDFYDAKNKVIHEIKKSGSMEAAHEWQVKYYIWLLEQNEIHGATGVLEYPKLREKKEVRLAESDRDYLQNVMRHIQQLTEEETCPPLIAKQFCKSCSYFDFCWIGD